MNLDQEKELAEVILRTRRWAFRDALPVIVQTVRRIAGDGEERRRGANKMIADYRGIISGKFQQQQP
jgi:hypothetical protein